MHDSIENQASVWTVLMAVRATALRLASARIDLDGDLRMVTSITATSMSDGIGPVGHGRLPEATSAAIGRWTCPSLWLLLNAGQGRRSR